MSFPSRSRAAASLAGMTSHSTNDLYSPGASAVSTKWLPEAVQSQAEWDGGADEAVSGLPDAPDPAAYERSVTHLRSLDPVRVHFAHDAAIWHR